MREGQRGLGKPDWMASQHVSDPGPELDTTGSPGEMPEDRERVEVLMRRLHLFGRPRVVPSPDVASNEVLPVVPQLQRVDA